MNRYISFSYRRIIFALFIFSAICDVALSETVIHVDNQHPSASDINPGSSILPLETISGAVRLADELNKQNTPTKVLVHPGTYRESVVLPFISDHSNTPAEIIIEGVSKGRVIISGSDVWTEWIKEPESNLYTHYWSYKWGMVPNPWPDRTLAADIMRRREMIFVAGEPLKQVLSFEELEEKSFYVLESEKKVYVWPQEGIDMNKAITEVAVRSEIFKLNGRENVTIRNFVFKHDNSGVDGNAVLINNSSNILIEDCAFIWNNWGGLRFNGSTDITVRRNLANHNGGRGMEAWKIKNALFEENTTSYNNWRGIRGNFTGFTVAGLKQIKIHDAVYRKHISLGNKSRGFWCDVDCNNIVIEDAILDDNLTDGIAINANQGPITIRNSAICNNGTGSGIVAGHSENVELEGNVLYGNGGTQIGLHGVGTNRAVKNWETGEEMQLTLKNMTIENNIIVGKDSEQTTIHVKSTPADGFTDILTSNNNIWYNADNTNVFIANGAHDLSTWRSVSGQDQDSVFEYPGADRITKKQKELLDLCMDQTSVSIISIKADVISDDSAEITWATNKPSDSKVEYGPTKSYGYASSVEPTLVLDHRFLLTGLSPETTYHFRVISKDQSGSSFMSEDSSFTTKKFTDKYSPSTPLVPTAIVISDSQINLSWGASTDNIGVAGYTIYRDGSAVATTINTYYSDTGLSESTKYSYTIKAYDSAGNESESSKPAPATTIEGSSGPQL